MQPTPKFEDLPLDPNGPPGNSWGRFGKDDELGMLNLLTSEVIAAAAKEIQTGIRISLDWMLDLPTYPSFGREPFKQEIVHRRPLAINDDMLTFNTQCSSQWDGFRHYAHQQSGLFYNGRSLEDIQGSDVIGTHVVADSGGISGRGVLIDYAAWAKSNSVQVEALKSSTITLDDLQTIVYEERIDFRPGDILFIRSGFTEAYEGLTDQQRQDLANRPSPDFAGVEATERMVRWLWKHQFAAVAGDAPSFERAPIRGAHADPAFNLHEWVLAGWGMPIGELFDLERLSKHCQETGRYTFFLASTPLKVRGGVASPPNAVAFF